MAATKRAAAPKTNAKPEPKGVHAKLAAIVAEVGHVDKTGSIAFGRTKYDYMQEHGLLALLKPLWEKHGVTFVVGVAVGLENAVSQVGNLATVVVQARLTDTDSGEDILAYYVGQGSDQGDKATNKALTGANKYALQKFFQVPTEQIDDSDATASEQAPRQQASPPVSQLQLVSADDADALRQIIQHAREERHLTYPKVQANLQSAYNVSTIDELTPEQAESFAQWVAEQIATSKKAAQG
jgi:hypothetical protein